MREAPSIKIAQTLTELGATVIAYDPIAINNAKKILGHSIHYADSALEAVKKVDALFLVTEWDEFKQLDLAQITKLMKQPIIFDGRNSFELARIRACPMIEYYPVGKSPIIKRS